MMGEYKKYVALLDSVYSDASENHTSDNDELSSNFLQFQTQNKNYFIVYAGMLSDLFAVTCKTDGEYQQKYAELKKIEDEIMEVSTEKKQNLSKQIRTRTQLIGMLADEIQNIE